MLERVFELSDDERDAVARHQGSLPLGITPYYASLMSREDAPSRLRRTHIPVGNEYLEDARRSRRPARRGPSQRRARPGAPLSRPRAVPGHRLLLHLLPLLHPLAHGRRGRRRLLVQPPAVGGGARLHRGTPRDPRRADLGRRPADPVATRSSTICSAACARSRHVEFVRLGTKVPVVLPMRITRSLVRDPQEAPSAVDEHPLHPPGRTDAAR